MDGTIHREITGHTLKITVDRPDKMNAFTPELMADLGAALTELDETPNLWTGVLCFAGKHTTAGLDMPKFFGPDAKTMPETGNVDPFGMRRKCTKPVVCAVQGKCLTVGIEMMLASDIVVAADNTTFCQMESKRGIAPFGGAHFRYVARAGWGNAMYHLMLCDEFSAARAQDIGFVQEVVETGAQIERAVELAELINKNAPLGIQEMKKSALTFIEDGEEAAIAYIPDMRERLFQTEDSQEGIRSFMERRSANFQGK